MASTFWRWTIWLGVGTWLVSCLGCDNGTTTQPISSGFRVETRLIDFGRVQEFSEETRTVSLISLSKASQTLSLSMSSDAPFSFPENFLLEGGVSAEIPVTFLAGDGAVETLLNVKLDDEVQTVELKALGARPKACDPPRECRVVRYDFPTDQCIESLSPNGTACTPESLCMENGACTDGKCLGETRSCDDQNRCTNEACAEGVGCVKADIECPPPTQLCRVPYCDPVTGCGTTQAADGTPCGSLDCTNAQVCLVGNCVNIVPPDGTPCAPKTPCQGEGTCQSQKCVRPPPGRLSPQSVVSLSEPPAMPARLLGAQGNVYLQTCNADPSLGCHLLSLTGSGLERFKQPLTAAPQALAHVAQAGALMVSSAGFDSYSPVTGALQWSFPYSAIAGPAAYELNQAQCLPTAIATTPSGDIVAAVASSWRLRDGGANTDAGVDDAGVEDAGFDAGPALPQSMSTQSVLWVSTGGQLLHQVETSDGGVPWVGTDFAGRVFTYEPSGALRKVSPQGVEFLKEYNGLESFLVGRDRLWAGLHHVLEADGGSPVAYFPWGSDGGPFESVVGEPLLSRLTGYVFYKTCEAPAMSCAEEFQKTMLRAFSSETGATQWEYEVLAVGEAGNVLESALMSMGIASTVTTSAQEAHLRAYLGAKEVFVCPFPQDVTPLAAVFERNRLFALVQGSNGWQIQQYDLGLFSTDSSAWPQAHGVSGTRQSK